VLNDDLRLVADAYLLRADEQEGHDLWFSVGDDLPAAHRAWEADWLDRRWDDNGPIFRISDRGMTAVQLAAMHAAAAANRN
jgi:hypothetical protein